MSAAMNHAAFNAANALGAYLGGLVVAAGLGYRAPAAVGVLCSIAGTAILLLALGLGRRRYRTRVV
jgi:DHA1 family inner membrane transport protein